MSGGGGLNQELIRAIEENLGVKLLVPPHPEMIAALGAAPMAEEKAK